jgi:hypothetical protein
MNWAPLRTVSWRGLNEVSRWRETWICSGLVSSSNSGGGGTSGWSLMARPGATSHGRSTPSESFYRSERRDGSHELTGCSHPAPERRASQFAAEQDLRAERLGFLDAGRGCFPITLRLSQGVVKIRQGSGCVAPCETSTFTGSGGEPSVFAPPRF